MKLQRGSCRRFEDLGLGLRVEDLFAAAEGLGELGLRVAVGP